MKTRARLLRVITRLPTRRAYLIGSSSAYRRAWRIWLVYLTQPRSQRGFVKRLMDNTPQHPMGMQPLQAESASLASANGTQPSQQPPKLVRLLLLVRHGQTTFNVEGRLPGQLPGVELTDEGRRQAQRAAVALSALPMSAVIASPLVRARETAEILARGWALPVRLEDRLKDTDVAFWAGQKIEEVNRTDPRWKAFVEHPTEPPEGVESLATVQQRAVAVVEDVLREPSLGNTIVLVAHADVIKLILAHYSRMAIEAIRYVHIGNASISVLAFGEESSPHLLAVNWTALPHWLFPPTSSQQAQSNQSSHGADQPAELAPPLSPEAPTLVQGPGGAELSERS